MATHFDVKEESITGNGYRDQVFLRPLPNDFLCSSANEVQQESSSELGIGDRQRQEESDHALAMQLQSNSRTQPVVGRLEVTVVRATLNKNYGMTRMDPYVRLHFGQQVFETQTDHNGAKSPVWNKTFYIYQLPKSFKNFHLEIYDERTITDDERIAFVTISLPESIRKGEVSDEWYQLSGKMGEGVEGAIYVIMSYTMSPMAAPLYPAPPNTMVTQMPQRPPPPITQEDVKAVSSMFPDIEEAVVLSVLENSGGNKEAAVEALLGMQQ